MVIITAVGADRPGMAHAVAAVLAHLGCSIEDTTMTRLSGEFAMILIVSPPLGVTLQTIEQCLSPLKVSHGLFINCKDIDEDVAIARQTEPAKSPSRYILSVYGLDKPGLLARISEVLAQHGVNITDVQTRVASAGKVYVMVFEIEVPLDLATAALSGALELAGQEISVQISLHPLDEETF